MTKELTAKVGLNFIDNDELYEYEHIEYFNSKRHNIKIFVFKNMWNIFNVFKYLLNVDEIEWKHLTNLLAIYLRHGPKLSAFKGKWQENRFCFALGI